MSRSPGAVSAHAAAGVRAGPAPLGDREFLLLRALVYRLAGIHLSEAKRALLAGRLARRVRELGLRSYGEYHALLLADDGGAERQRFVDLVCTNETRFFREERQFAFLAQAVFPRWRSEAAACRRPRRVCAWSAACSTGQEPYSLAMLLLDHFPPADGWEVAVLGTDVSSRALAQASAATWKSEQTAHVPRAYLRRFMLRGVGSQAGRVRAAPELRAVVRLQALNLHAPRYHVAGPFDLVLCRNVLIYFTAEDRARIVERLLPHVASDGYLMLGHAEGLGTAPRGLRCALPTVYGRVATEAAS